MTMPQEYSPQIGDEIEVIGGPRDGLRGRLTAYGQHLISIKDTDTQVTRQVAKNEVRELKLIKRKT